MLEFEWDAEKAQQNLAKHGIDFGEAATILSAPLSLTFYDPDHSQTEDRFITMGCSTGNKLLVVSHTDRNVAIRIISARKATRSERVYYEQEVL